MKLVTFTRDGAARIGALTQRDGRDVVIDLNQAAPSLPNDMIAFLTGGEMNHTLATQAIAAEPKNPLWPRTATRICLSKNWSMHCICKET